MVCTIKQLGVELLQLLLNGCQRKSSRKPYHRPIYVQVLRFHVSISFEWHNEIEIETSSHQATYEKAIGNI